MIIKKIDIVLRYSNGAEHRICYLYQQISKHLAAHTATIS